MIPNDFLLAVPSRHRAEIFKKNTFSWLQHLTPYKVFLEREDLPYYDYVDKENIVVLEESGLGLGYVKEQIKKYAEANNKKFIFKVDDDVYGWVSKERGGTKKGINVKPVIEELLANCIQVLTNEEIVAISFPYRNEMFEVKKWTGMNARLQSCYIIRLDYFFADRRYSAFEDFATFINIRLNNKLTLRYGYAAQDVLDVGRTAGGQADFDRKQMALAEVNLIRSELYPALKIKKVENKIWDFEPDLRGGIFMGKKL